MTVSKCASKLHMACILVTNLLLLLAYDSCFGILLVYITDHQVMRQRLGIDGSDASFNARHFVHTDWYSGTPHTFNPDMYNVLRFVGSQLQQAVTHFEWIIPAQAGCRATNQPPNCIFPSSQCTIYFCLLYSQSWFLWLWNSWNSTHGMLYIQLLCI